MFALGVFIAALVLSVIDQIVFGRPVLAAVLALAAFIPAIACQVRRFHDQDKPGWYLLLGLIPFVGGIIVLVFMCLEGTRGPNQFGPDPKGNDVAATFS